MTLGVLDLTKAVTFATAMPSSDFEVFFQVKSNVSVIMWSTSLSTAGFTINVSAGIIATVSYEAVQN